MEKIEIKTQGYVLKEWEAIVIKKCLEYCRHRLDEHPDSGICKAVRHKDIKRILEDF